MHQACDVTIHDFIPSISFSAERFCDYNQLIIDNSPAQHRRSQPSSEAATSHVAAIGKVQFIVVFQPCAGALDSEAVPFLPPMT
jgi:hypothetical protein